MADVSLKKIPVDLIVFDLDGTLAASLPDLINAANYAMRRLGLPERPGEAFKGMIGGGERMFMERLLGPGHLALLEDCLELYLDYYTRHRCDRTRLYSGVPETLERLSGKKNWRCCPTNFSGGDAADPDGPRDRPLSRRRNLAAAAPDCP